MNQSANACKVTLHLQEHDYDTLRRVRGGVLSTLLDSVMLESVHTSMPAGKRCLPHELRVNFHRPVDEDAGEIFAEGHVVSCSSRLATAEGRITDVKGY